MLPKKLVAKENTDSSINVAIINLMSWVDFL
jgi:hypothetical protein